MPLVECVPNFSEGRNPSVIAAIRNAIDAIPDTHVLDVSSDASHHRSVITFVAPIERAVDAAFAGIAEAARVIDLTAHRGEHPRIGATDVVPFIPLDGATMDDCVVLARLLGDRVGRELSIPVYLYERAATRPSRTNLADVRRGEFEGLRDAIRTDVSRAPDFGPSEVHRSAGATAIGARPFLVAYNVYLGPSSNLPVAKEVAKAIRGSSGGYAGIKALGLDVDGQAQLSMNLVDLDRTPLHRAFEAVEREARAHGVAPTWSELVGLVPERALLDAGARHIQLRGFSRDMIIEHRVRELSAAGESREAFVANVAAPTPTPGGGSAAAHTGALATALVQMVAGLTIGKKAYAAAEEEMKAIALECSTLRQRLSALVEEDATAYEAVRRAYQLPRDDEVQQATRLRAIDEALLGAAGTPLETAQSCARVVALARAVLERGNRNASSDAGTAELLATGAARAALLNVRVNLAALGEPLRGSAIEQAASTIHSELAPSH
jgi:glutamate formiminotransferase / formiminotetrahydrofolate cyclodeaminase